MASNRCGARTWLIVGEGCAHIVQVDGDQSAKAVIGILPANQAR